MKMKTKNTEKSGTRKKVDGTGCNDRECPLHGRLKTRGRVFEGEVIRKFPRRVTIRLGRMVYVRKYERYLKKETKIHARLSECMNDSVNKGDIIRVRECRPLSKIIHFVTVEKVKDPEKSQEEKNESNICKNNSWT